MANVLAMCFSLSNVLAVIDAVRVVPPAANYLRAGPLMRRTVSAYRLLFFLLPFLYLIGKTGGEEDCNDFPRGFPSKGPPAALPETVTAIFRFNGEPVDLPKPLT